VSSFNYILNADKGRVFYNKGRSNSKDEALYLLWSRCLFDFSFYFSYICMLCVTYVLLAFSLSVIYFKMIFCCNCCCWFEEHV